MIWYLKTNKQTHLRAYTTSIYTNTPGKYYNSLERLY